jgi:hypothetical protein
MTFASTEDGQLAGTGDDALSRVVSRCVEVSFGHRACYTTLPGSCVQNITRCAPGDLCMDACGAGCTCIDGFIICTFPEGPCGAEPSCHYLYSHSELPDPSAPGTDCECASDTHRWQCHAE